MPILEGLDGVQKMSKSLNNYIGIAAAPDDSLASNVHIWWINVAVLELLSFRPMEEISYGCRIVSKEPIPRNYKV